MSAVFVVHLSELFQNLEKVAVEVDLKFSSSCTMLFPM